MLFDPLSLSILQMQQLDSFYVKVLMFCTYKILSRFFILRPIDKNKTGQNM